MTGAQADDEDNKGNAGEKTSMLADRVKYIHAATMQNKWNAETHYTIDLQYRASYLL